MWRWLRKRRSASATASRADDGGRAGDDSPDVRLKHLELHEKLLSIREKELFALREDLVNQRLTLTRFVLVGTVVFAVLSFFGIQQYRDLQKLIRDSLTAQINATAVYYDKLMRAKLLSQNHLYKSAEAAFRELYDAKPEDEMVFIGLLDSLIQQEDFDRCCAVVEKAEKAEILPRKCQMLLSFNSAGFALMLHDITNPVALQKAFQYLRKAEEIGATQNDPNIVYPLFNLAVYYMAQNDIPKAQAYGRRWRDLESAPLQKQWTEMWAKRLRPSRPNLDEIIVSVFGDYAQAGASSSPSPPSSSNATSP